MILSYENSDRLYWLGRYCERVFTGLRSFARKFDEIPGIQAKEDYAKSFCFDKDNTSSVCYSLLRAYDNAIVLRDEIGSETFSYIQLALYEIQKAEKSKAVLIPLQKVNDNIAAFWGMADDIIEDEQIRSILKLGRRIERVDLYARMKAQDEDIRREIRRLNHRLAKTGLVYDKDGLARLNGLAQEESMNYPQIVREVESLVQFAS